VSTVCFHMTTRAYTNSLQCAIITTRVRSSIPVAHVAVSVCREFCRTLRLIISQLLYLVLSLKFLNFTSVLCRRLRASLCVCVASSSALCNCVEFAEPVCFLRRLRRMKYTLTMAAVRMSTPTLTDTPMAIFVP
jgi:hypothetical protein